MHTYVYLGVAKNDSATFVDIAAFDVGREPTAHALALLDEHRSCDRVEIWREDDRVAVIARADEGPRP